MPTPSGIPSGDDAAPDWNAHDDDVCDRMTYAALYETAGPQEFDEMVNGDPEMQRTLLRWRSHLALAARAYYRMAVNAYGEEAGKPDLTTV